MSAALKFEPLVERPRPSSQAAEPQPRLRVVPEPGPAAPVVFPDTGRRDRPTWLKLLVVGQRVSLVVAGLAVTGTLSAYALTVDTNRRLTMTTATLGQLQDHQQQLTTANAVFKNHLAQTAITAMQAGTLHPKDVIFLEVAAPQPEASAPQPQVTDTIPKERRFFPKGY